MIPSLEEIIRRTGDQLRQDLDVSVGLSKVARSIGKAQTPTEAVQRAKREVRSCTRNLKAAEAKLERLRQAVRRIGEVLPYTPQGWPERREEIERELKRDPRSGLLMWLGDWLTATADCRLDAMARLESVGEFPTGAELLRQRCLSTRVGIEQRNAHLAVALLQTGANGVAIGEKAIPTGAVRAELDLLRIRLLLVHGLLDEADAALVSAAQQASASVDALRARYLRLRGEAELARSELEKAAASAPANMDVAAAVVETARLNAQDQLAIDAARIAVSAVPVLVDIEAEIDPLVGWPTAELWAAVAERALTEKDFRVHTLAVERGCALEPQGTALAAMIAQLRARGAAEQQLGTEELIDAFLQAGIAQVVASHGDLAIDDFERVLQLAPEHREASVRLADCLTVASAKQPLKTGRKGLERALKLLEDVRARDGVDTEHSWSYLSEALAHQRLSEAVAIDARRHAWQALLAVCRALVHDARAADRWRQLSWAAQTLSLGETGIAAASHALELDPDNPASQTEYVLALVNASRFDEALARLGAPTDSWSHAIHAHALLRKGQFEQAMIFMQNANPDPDWAWASMTLLAALVLSGREEEAKADAKGLYDWWRDRIDEKNGASAATWASIVLGEYPTAESLTDRLEPIEQAAALGVVLLLQGNPEAAVIAFRTSVGVADDISDLNELSQLLLPLACSLAKQRTAVLPELAPIEEMIIDRQRELAEGTEAIAQLRNARVSDDESDAATTAKALCIALLEFARGDIAAGLEAISPLAEQAPGDVEVRALRQMLHAELDSRTAPAAPAVSGGRAVGDLRNAAARAVADVAARANAVLDETTVIEAVLPPSWFEGYTDPLNDHALFLRCIPEVRARATWTVPRIHVTTDSVLEPDGYRFRHGELSDEGRVDLDSRYGTAEAFEFLGITPEDDSDPDLRRAPKDAIADDDVLASLVTMDTLELVAMRISDVARRGAADGVKPRLSRRVAAALSRAVSAWSQTGAYQ